MPSPNFRYLCLTIAFVACLMAYLLWRDAHPGGDTGDLLLFFVWATFIPLYYGVVIAPMLRRAPHS